MSDKKSDNEVNEAFAEVIGWEMLEMKGNTLYGVHPMARYHDPLRPVPNWCQDWPAFKRDVFGRMERDGFKYTTRLQYWVWWIEDQSLREFPAPIKNNEILRAGVEAAVMYLKEGRKG